MSNRLAHESSPYLRQHAHNPVDWFPWGDDALRRARELDRPIFLSIGYSACHWCHVMEKESFEDAAIGKLLNDHFVSIKVDREERPDLDQIYMTAVQILTQQGGWPMSMFLTPDLKPFFGGTYFPPDDRYGRPGFGRLLTRLAEAWRDKRSVIEEQASQLTSHVQGSLDVEGGSDAKLGPDLLRNAGNTLRRAFDSRHGGFGSAPKFPHPMELRLLLRLWKRFGDDEALRMAQVTLDRMAMGGIYDHLGGGFHRYSTDANWLVPHFEMLYDNALLTSAYVEAFQATRNPFYREVIDETLGYVLREMTSPEGAFYSTQDADSEGEEGKFFVWTLEEVQSLLGPNVSKVFAQVYDVSTEGNWEGHNILHRAKTYEQDAKLLRIPEDELCGRLAAGKQKLFDTRSRRIWPGKDDKILTAWNAIMLGAFAQAGATLDQPAYIEAARRAADFLLTRMRTPTGLLHRTTSPNGRPKLNAYLEDYSYVIDSLVSLYEATFEPRWIEAALDLAETMFAEFWDDKDGGFFYTGKAHEQLIARTKDPHDSSVPSGNSMAVTALLRLAKLTGRSDLFDRAEKTLRLFHGLLGSSPLAAGQMLIALDFYLGPVQEICVVGDPVKPAVKEAVNLLHRNFLPHTVLALWSGAVATEVEKMIPLLANREAKGDVTTYICQNFTCQAPLIGVEALARGSGLRS